MYTKMHLLGKSQKLMLAMKDSLGQKCFSILNLSTKIGETHLMK